MQEFVSLPEEIEGDQDRHVAFLEQQANRYREQILSEKSKRRAKAAAKAANASVAVEESTAPSSAPTPSDSGQKKKKTKRERRREKKKKLDELHAAGVEVEESVKARRPKKKKAKEEKVQKEEQEKEEEENVEEDFAPVQTAPLSAKKIKKEAEEDELQKKLMGARFRLLNEQLYSMGSTEAVALFEEHPELFEVYHKGFAEQIAKWPENPLNFYVSTIKQLAREVGLKKLVVADFGCGDGRLAMEIMRDVKKVHSFDLVAKFPHITATDMAKVPLPDACVDVGVFCLALMGTNWEDFVREANRVLKVGGQLFITEVTSRIQDANKFALAIRNLGFNLVDKNDTNTHFIRFSFTKNGKHPKTKSSGVVLGVCKYKKR